MDQGCRRAQMLSCDAFTNFTVGAKPPLNSTDILVKAGDIIDVGIFWGPWLDANGARLKSSVWAAGGDSPQVPTFSGPVMDEKSGETAVLIDASAAAAGNRYYLDNTVVVQRNGSTNPLAIADRTMVRRISVKVAAG